MSDFQEANSSAHSLGELTLASITQDVRNAGLSHVLDHLPHHSEYEITVQDGLAALNVGCAFLNRSMGDCLLWHNFGTSISGLPKSYERPSYEWLGSMDSETRNKKGVFAWDRDLYEGLFKEQMDPRSVELLQYYFIQWGTGTQAANEVLEDILDRGIHVESLCEALEMLGDTDHFKILLQQDNQSITADSVIETEQRILMDIDSFNGNDENRASTTAIIDKIKTEFPAVEYLPSLKDSNLIFEPHEKNDPILLPLRLCIGTWIGGNGESKVWMYTTLTSIRGEGSQPHCKVESKDERGILTEIKSLKIDDSPDLNEVKLVEIFKSSKGSTGHNYRPVGMLARYYMLLKFKETGQVNFGKGDITLSGTFIRYFKTALNNCSSNDIKLVKQKTNGPTGNQNISHDDGLGLTLRRKDWAPIKTTPRAFDARSGNIREPSNDSHGDGGSARRALHELSRGELLEQELILQTNFSMNLRDITNRKYKWNQAQETVHYCTDALNDAIQELNKANQALYKADGDLDTAVEAQREILHELNQVQQLLKGTQISGPTATV